MKNTIRILNPKQIDVFIKNGCTPVGCDVGYGGKVYIDFVRDEPLNVILKKWQKREFMK